MQQKINKQQTDILARTYITTRKNRKGTYGTAIIFPKPSEQKEFRLQKPEKILTLDEFEEKYKIRINTKKE